MEQVLLYTFVPALCFGIYKLEYTSNNKYSLGWDHLGLLLFFSDTLQLFSICLFNCRSIVIVSVGEFLVPSKKLYVLHMLFCRRRRLLLSPPIDRVTTKVWYKS